jgi:hypothetical protein
MSLAFTFALPGSASHAHPGITMDSCCLNNVCECLIIISGIRLVYVVLCPKFVSEELVSDLVAFIIILIDASIISVYLRSCNIG